MDSTRTTDAQDAIRFDTFKRFLLEFRFTDFHRIRTPVRATTSRKDLERNLRILQLPGKDDLVVAIIGRVRNEEKYALIEDAYANSKGTLRPKPDTFSSQANSLKEISAFEHRNDPSRSILFVYPASAKNEKIHKALESILSTVHGNNSGVKLSGLIYVEDVSTSSPTKPAKVDFDLLDQCVEGHNVTVITTGWGDDKAKNVIEKMRKRQSKLTSHWDSLMNHDGFSIIRLAARGKTSREVSHDSWDAIGPLLKRALKPSSKEQRKTGGHLLPDAQSNDLVVLVMGPPGVGKSTFINHVVGKPVALVDYTLISEHLSLQPIAIPHFTDSTRRIILLEMPGFDNATLDDEEVLRHIAEALTNSYSENFPIAGVIYMHDISQPRVGTTVKHNLNMFSKMIGRNAAQNVVFVTTKGENVGPEREDQLRKNHWNDLISAGARLSSFRNSDESAQEVMRFVLEPGDNTIQTLTHLKIQEEIVDDKKKLSQTEASRALLLPASTAVKVLQNVEDLERQFPGVREFLLSFGSFESLGQVIKRVKPTAGIPLNEIFGKNDLVIAITGTARNEQKHAFIDDASAVSEGALCPKADTTSKANSPAGICVFKHPDDSSRSIFFLYLPSVNNEKIHDVLVPILKLSLVLGDNSGLKLSGLIHIEDISSSPPIEPSITDFHCLGQCVEDYNVTIVTTGWDGSASPARREETKSRHLQLYKYWEPLVDSGDVTVVRVSEPGKNSKEVFHNSWNVIKDILDKPKSKAMEVQRRNPEGISFADAQVTDLVIPVMGPSGVGKSTFINHVVGEPVALVGHTLISETFSLQPVVVPFPTDPSRRIILVDTPGFDDSTLDDEEILRRIAEWLTNSYSEKIPLAGILYLHDISQTRMLGTVKKNLEVFSKMIGRNATRNVVLLTTKWGLVQETVGLRREEQLIADHWNDLKSLGARFYSFKDSHDSAKEAVKFAFAPADEMQTPKPVIHAKIQTEIVDDKKILSKTEAAKALVLSLEDVLQRLQQECEEATGVQKKELRKRIAEINKQIRMVRGQSNIITKLSSIVKEALASRSSAPTPNGGKLAM